MPFKVIQSTDYSQANYPPPLWISYIVSVAAAGAAEFVTYPLDLTKTRLQIQGELANKTDSKISSAPYRGMLKTAYGIAREEGLHKLFQGMSAGLARHVIYSGTRIVTYQCLRDNVFKKKPGEHFPIWKSALCGISAGAFAQYLASPADLVKVHLQMEGKRRMMGLPPRVHGLADAFKKVWKAGGIKGLWKGSVPNMQRAALVNLGDLTTYDYTKRFMLMNTSLKDNHVLHVICSFLAGFVAAGMGTPADVIKTRVMNQPVDNNGRPSLALSFGGASVSVRDVFISQLGVIRCTMEATPITSRKQLFKDFLELVSAIFKNRTRVFSGYHIHDYNTSGLLYKSSVDCLLQAVKGEGVGSLYKGFFPIWLRMAPWSLTFWISYEEVMSFLGTSY